LQRSRIRYWIECDAACRCEARSMETSTCHRAGDLAQRALSDNLMQAVWGPRRIVRLHSESGQQARHACSLGPRRFGDCPHLYLGRNPVPSPSSSNTRTVSNSNFVTTHRCQRPHGAPRPLTWSPLTSVPPSERPKLLLPPPRSVKEANIVNCHSLFLLSLTLPPPTS
jgi:hypothetical protein